MPKHLVIRNATYPNQSKHLADVNTLAHLLSMELASHSACLSIALNPVPTSAYDYLHSPADYMPDIWLHRYAHRLTRAHAPISYAGIDAVPSWDILIASSDKALLRLANSKAFSSVSLGSLEGDKLLRHSALAKVAFGDMALMLQRCKLVLAPNELCEQVLEAVAHRKPCAIGIGAFGEQLNATLKECGLTGVRSPYELQCMLEKCKDKEPDIAIGHQLVKELVKLAKLSCTKQKYGDLCYEKGSASAKHCLPQASLANALLP